MQTRADAAGELSGLVMLMFDGLKDLPMAATGTTVACG
jgi:hypothetical protein